MRRSIVLGVALIGLALAGCGSGSASGGASKIGVAAGAKTAAAKTFHVQGTTERSGPDTPDSGVIDAVVDLEHHAIRSTMPARTSSVDTACVPSPCASPQPSQTRVNGPSTTISIGSDTWTKTEGDQSSLYGGLGVPPGKWVHLPKGRAADPTAIYDPSRWLGALRSTDDATLVGQEQVRGVATDHYRFTVRSTSGTTGSRPPTHVDAWISHDGLVRRLRSVATAATAVRNADGSTQTITFTTTLELFDFGVAANITPPPADEVVELPHCTPPGCASATLSMGG
ncbi:MAG: LppX LprAFG lipoprotein [Actinomycetota bacterium]|nr:LppX LprAFG lipoprotein [Actinomycetota bacterium]